jgi:hypothetical protein
MYVEPTDFARASGGRSHDLPPIEPALRGNDGVYTVAELSAQAATRVSNRADLSIDCIPRSPDAPNEKMLDGAEMAVAQFPALSPD